MSYHPLQGKVAISRNPDGSIQWYDVAAGLGATYDIPTNVPLFPVLRLDVPMPVIMHDALDAMMTDVWTRTKKHWPFAVAGGLVLGAAVILRKKKP